MFLLKLYSASNSLQLSYNELSKQRCNRYDEQYMGHNMIPFSRSSSRRTKNSLSLTSLTSENYFLDEELKWADQKINGVHPVSTHL